MVSSRTMARCPNIPGSVRGGRKLCRPPIIIHIIIVP